MIAKHPGRLMDFNNDAAEVAEVCIGPTKTYSIIRPYFNRTCVARS